MRRFVGELLQSNGYVVRETSSPDEALRILGEGSAIDLLMVDYAMPGINGMDIIQQARQQRPGLKALLITGYAGAVRDDAAGAALLRKPFGPVELCNRVAAVLAA